MAVLRLLPAGRHHHQRGPLIMAAATRPNAAEIPPLAPAPAGGGGRAARPRSRTAGCAT
jgi:hypothetical protein